MNQKHQQTIYHGNVNVDLMEENIIEINGTIMINVDASVKKSCHVYEKDCVWNPATYAFENGKYLAIIMNDSGIMCDKIRAIQQKNYNYPNTF